MRFVDEYAIDQNGTQAAIRAGYSPNTARNVASRLLRDERIKKALDVKLGEIAQRNSVTQDRVLLELKRLGFSSMAEVATWDEYGVRFRTPEEMTEDAVRSIESIQSRREVRRDRGGDEVVTVNFKMKQHSKVSALDMMARYVGLYDGQREDGTERWNELLDALSGERRPPSGDPEEPWVD